MNKVDFIVVGCMKAGTTTVVQHLNSHPDVSCLVNELQYFSDDTKFDQGISWYHQQLKTNLDCKLVGEKSTAYSYLPQSARRISQYNSQTKLIWVLRNPVKRAYSNYWHAVMAGVEKKSFQSCIEQHLSDKNIPLFEDYLARSCYVLQVKNFLKHFPLQQMHFVFIEDLWLDSNTVLKGLADFLNISNSFRTEQQELRVNVGYKPFSINMEFYTRKLFGGGIVWKLVHEFNRRFGSPYPKINTEDANKLESYFAPFNEELFRIIECERKKW